MNRTIFIAAGALLLAACKHTPEPPIVASLPPSPVVCPASATAPVPPRPTATLTAEEREALDVAVITTLGEDKGIDVLRAEAAEQPWAQALVRRIADMARWCAEND